MKPHPIVGALVETYTTAGAVRLGSYAGSNPNGKHFVAVDGVAYTRGRSSLRYIDEFAVGMNASVVEKNSTERISEYFKRNEDGFSIWQAALSHDPNSLGDILRAVAPRLAEGANDVEWRYVVHKLARHPRTRRYFYEEEVPHNGVRVRPRSPEHVDILTKWEENFSMANTSHWMFLLRMRARIHRTGRASPISDWIWKNVPLDWIHLAILDKDDELPQELVQARKRLLRVDPKMWHPEDWMRIRGLREYAVSGLGDYIIGPQILQPLGMTQVPWAAYDLLVRVGAAPRDADAAALMSPQLREFWHVGFSPLRNAGVPSNRPLSSTPVSSATAAHKDVAPWRKSAVDVEQTVFTIDPVDCIDVDDGVSVDLRPDSPRYGWISVHIADAAGELQSNSPLDHWTRKRASSLYLPLHTYHMLPEALTRACSLEPRSHGDPSHAVTICMHIDSSGAVDAYEIFPSRLKRLRKIPYPSMDRILASLINSSTHGSMEDIICASNDQRPQSNTPNMLSAAECEALVALQRASERRSTYRSTRSRSLFIPSPQVEVHGYGRDRIIRVTPEESDSPAKKLVAELMIAASEAFGRYASEHKLPILYRCQEPPESLLHPSHSGARGGIGLPELFSDAPDRETLEAIWSILQQKRAYYSLTSDGHHSLGLHEYAHCTSPIRRYPDLLNHRTVLTHLTGQKDPPHLETAQSVAMINETLDRSRKLEHDSRRFWILSYLRQLSGSAASPSGASKMPKDYSLDAIVHTAHSDHTPPGLIRPFSRQFEVGLYFPSM